MLVVTCLSHGQLGKFYDLPTCPIDADKDVDGKEIGKSAQRQRAEQLARPHEPHGVKIELVGDAAAV